MLYSQPPSGGCELKLPQLYHQNNPQNQPPSGGCELKLPDHTHNPLHEYPAAFGRL